MGLGSIISRVVPIAIGVTTGGPLGGITAALNTEKAKRAEKRQGARIRMYTQDPGLSQGYEGFSNAQNMTSDAGFFSNLGSGVRDFGRNVGNFFNDIRPAAELFGFGNNLPRTNSGVAATIIRQRPDETAMSGEILGANLGMAPAIFNAGRNFLRTPQGQTALGFGAGAVGAAFMGDGMSAPRITRKMKADVRRIYMMAGMDPNATAQILNNLGTYPRMNFDASLVFFILTKRFRNDGPVVTKAAVRKTKTTLRRMKGVVDMYNSVCKPTRSRAPARKPAPKAVQLIKN